jgi:hypothetical protein
LDFSLGLLYAGGQRVMGVPFQYYR